MNLRKWLISAIILTLAVGTAGTITTFALTDSGGDGPEVQDRAGTTWEDPHGDPTYEEWLSDHGDETVVTSSAKSPTDGLCLPAVPLAVSVGDSWTISRPVDLPEGFPTELPVGAAVVSITFTVDAIGTKTYVRGRGDAPIDHPTVQLKVTNVARDADGNVLSTEDDPRVARGISWTPASVMNR